MHQVQHAQAAEPSQVSSLRPQRHGGPQRQLRQSRQAAQDGVEGAVRQLARPQAQALQARAALEQRRCSAGRQLPAGQLEALVQASGQAGEAGSGSACVREQAQDMQDGAAPQQLTSRQRWKRPIRRMTTAGSEGVACRPPNSRHPGVLIRQSWNWASSVHSRSSRRRRRSSRPSAAARGLSCPHWRAHHSTLPTARTSADSTSRPMRRSTASRDARYAAASSPSAGSSPPKATLVNERHSPGALHQTWCQRRHTSWHCLRAGDGGFQSGGAAAVAAAGHGFQSSISR